MSTPYGTPIVPQGMQPIGAWLSWAFQEFGANVGIWLVQGLISLGFFLPFLVITVVAQFGFENQQWAPLAYTSYFGSLVLYLIAYSYLSAGMIYTALKRLRGEPVAVGDIFKAGYALPNLIGLSLIAGILITVGCCFCIVPGLIAGGVWIIAAPIIVDRRAGVIQSLSESFDIIKQNIWMFVLFFFILYMILSVGSSCWIGIIAALPIYILAQTYAYFSIYHPTHGTGMPPHGAGPQPYLPPAYNPQPGETPGQITPPPPPPPPRLEKRDDDTPNS